MRLGATIDDYLDTNDPDALVAECRRKGYRAAAMPLGVLDQADVVRSIARGGRLAAAASGRSTQRLTAERRSWRDEHEQ